MTALCHGGVSMLLCGASVGVKQASLRGVSSRGVPFQISRFDSFHFISNFVSNFTRRYAPLHGVKSLQNVRFETQDSSSSRQKHLKVYILSYNYITIGLNTSRSPAHTLPRSAYPLPVGEGCSQQPAACSAQDGSLKKSEPFFKSAAAITLVIIVIKSKITQRNTGNHKPTQASRCTMQPLLLQVAFAHMTC